MKTFLRNLFTRSKSGRRTPSFRPQLEGMEERLVMDVGGFNHLGLTAQTAIVTDFDGRVIGDQNPDIPLAMASTTKIMTTLLAIELAEDPNNSIHLADEVEISRFASQIPGSGFNNYVPGERFQTLEDALYVVMRQSDNAASQAVAEHIVRELGLEANNELTTNELTGALGVVQDMFANYQLPAELNDPLDPGFSLAGVIPNFHFTAMMTERARELGMTSTQFQTPSGIGEVPGHHSTATDMATLARAAMRNAKFREIAADDSIKPISMLVPDGQPKQNTLNSSSSGLLSGAFAYPGAEGLKGGWTPLARGALVSQATILGRTLDGVVLGVNAGGTAFGDQVRRAADTHAILNHSFDRAYGFEMILQDSDGDGNFDDTDFNGIPDAYIGVETVTGEYRFASREFTVTGTSGNDDVLIDYDGRDVIITVNGNTEQIPVGDVDSWVYDSEGFDRLTLTASAFTLDFDIKNASNHTVRELLPTNPYFSMNGDNLIVSGTGGDDFISIYRYSTQMWISVNGHQSWVTSAPLNSIYVDAQAGQDTITISGSPTEIEAGIVIDTGAGDDSVTLRNNVGLGTFNNWVAVVGQTGEDSVSVNDSGSSSGQDFSIRDSDLQRNGHTILYYYDVDRLNVTGSNYQDTFSIDSLGSGTDVNINGQSGETLNLRAGDGTDQLGVYSGHLTLNRSEVTVGDIRDLDVDFGDGNSFTNFYSFSLFDDIRIVGGRYLDSLRIATSESPTGTLEFFGEGGDDWVYGPNRENNWTITGNDRGTLNSEINFWSVESLYGNEMTDTFAFAPGGFSPISMSGNIDGGGGEDVLDYFLQNVTVAISLLGHNQLSATGIDGTAISIERAIGSHWGNDTINGPDADMTWSIIDRNDGFLENENAGYTRFEFTSFENLIGGDHDDSFRFYNGGSIGRTVEGGVGEDEYHLIGTYDVLDEAVVHAHTVTFNNRTYDFADFETLRLSMRSGNSSTTVEAFPRVNSFYVTGGFAHDTFIINSPDQPTGEVLFDGQDFEGDTLIAANRDNIWDIDTTNSGILNDTIQFQGIENLQGNDGRDTFAFVGSGNISGTIDGAGEQDTLDFSAADSAVNVTMLTQTTMYASRVGGGASNVDAVTGSSYTDTFVGTDASTGWSIYNYDQAVMWRSAPLSKFYIRGFNNLTSGAGNDTFWIAPKRGMSGLVDTGDGDDSIFMQSNSRVDDTLIDGNSITLAGWTSTFANAERLQIDLGDGNSTTTIDAFPDVDEFILNGGNDEDVLHVNTVVPAGMTVSYHGMGGNDTLVGPDIFYNNWFISGLNSGSIYDQSEWSTFDGFENLTGGSDLEYFAIYPNGSISGAIDGGGGRDIINYKWYSSGVRVDLTNGTATGVGHISNVPRIIGSPFADFLRGDEQSNYINGYNRGTDVTDVILGMGGDDLLYGGGIIIGGQGQDDLVGSSGEDLIIADSTIYDDHEQVELIFTELLELWRRQDLSFEERVDLLRNGHSISGLGTVALNSSTIQDDGRVDRIQGMSGRDWYFAALAEAIDFDPDEDRLN